MGRHKNSISMPFREIPHHGQLYSSILFGMMTAYTNGAIHVTERPLHK